MKSILLDLIIIMVYSSTGWCSSLNREKRSNTIYSPPDWHVDYYPDFRKYCPFPHQLPWCKRRYEEVITINEQICPCIMPFSHGVYPHDNHKPWVHPIKGDDHHKQGDTTNINITPVNVQENPQQISTIQTQIPTIQSQIPSIQTQIPTIQSQFPKIEVQNPTIQTQIPTIQSQFPKIEVQNPTIQTQIPSTPLLYPDPSNDFSPHFQTFPNNNDHRYNQDKDDNTDINIINYQNQNQYQNNVQPHAYQPPRVLPPHHPQNYDYKVPMEFINYINRYEEEGFPVINPNPNPYPGNIEINNKIPQKLYHKLIPPQSHDIINPTFTSQNNQNNKNDIINENNQNTKVNADQELNNKQNNTAVANVKIEKDEKR